MMNCVHCGKESKEILCQDCMTADNIKTAFYNLLYFDSGTGNQSLREYVDSHDSPMEAKKDGLPYLLEHFDGPDADFLWCRYYKVVKDERFEEAAVSYLESHEDMDVNYQKLLLDLMGYYSRHEFEKPRKWAGKHLVSESIGEFLEVIGFLDEKSKDYGDRLDAQEGFLAILRDYEDIFGDYQLSARIDRLVNYLEKYADTDYKYHDFKKNSATEDAVQVLTMHKSKGLEFDTVFIPQMVDGEFPSTASHGRQYWQILGGKFRPPVNQSGGLVL